MVIIVQPTGPEKRLKALVSVAFAARDKPLPSKTS
ncbi:hypothetical protein cje21_04298 [Campylobacter jejuni subsp. jejuni 1997-7]|nr:hypothetical protein cje21_04298 [Campylobacter jejuni subsp. jejuni 1997-7]EIB79478.1 hypothetical protein cje77_07178 [Campylobacter jejuni subsp. jejuni 1854]EIB85242.1 hypothetical protein cje79_01975 [Campylobacter jejuni subsp. jejuni 1893]